jgi:hypothetical protein
MTTTRPYIYEGTGSATEDYFAPNTNNSKPPSGDWGIFDKKNKQHLTLLSQLRTVQWTIPHERYGEVADLARLSDFLKSDKSPVKKPLKSMEPHEVSKIIECFKSMVVKKYK